MDIIIKNGVIQEKEAKRVNDIKNEEGLLKKNYTEYVNGVPGPYYDLTNSHICVPRKHYNIQNFCGPQIENKIKLIQTTDFNKKSNYCSICHKLMTLNPAYSVNVKSITCSDANNTASSKDKISDLHKVEKEFKKFKISDEINDEINDENNDKNNLYYDLNKLNDKISTLVINYKSNWFNLFDKIKKLNHSTILLNYKKKYNKVITKYYHMVYKLLNNPILYHISYTETKLLWPWELTSYQKFKLTYPDYKSNIIFARNDNKITENYVIIE